MMVTKEEVGTLLDSLLLESLHLIEEQTKCRVNIERINGEGQLLLAQTRYQQGSMAISRACIPTENGNEFNALCHVKNEKNDDSLVGTNLELERVAVNKAEGYFEPLSWFSALPPQSLRTAATKFKRCIELVIESANVQRELTASLDNIQMLHLYIAQKFGK